MGKDQAGMEVVTALQMLAERLSAGDAISEADVRTLLQSRDLITVGMMADEVRRRIHGVRTTFVRVFEVHVDAPPAALPPSLSAGEIRIVGAPPSIERAVSVVSMMSNLAGPVPLTGFSLPDLIGLGPLRDVAERLRDAGLHAVAEIPVDGAFDVEAIVAAREGGLHVDRLSVNQFGDVPQITLIHRAMELHRLAGGIQVFAPLPRVVSPVTPTTGYDDVKLVAMARVMASHIPSIQVDWPSYGPKLAQVALVMGADDVDGVAAYDPATLGTRRSALAEITGNIRAAALDPLERNGRFEIIQ